MTYLGAVLGVGDDERSGGGVPAISAWRTARFAAHPLWPLVWLPKSGKWRTLSSYWMLRKKPRENSTDSEEVKDGIANA